MLSPQTKQLLAGLPIAVLTLVLWSPFVATWLVESGGTVPAPRNPALELILMIPATLPAMVGIGLMSLWQTRHYIRDDGLEWLFATAAILIGSLVIGSLVAALAPYQTWQQWRLIHDFAGITPMLATPMLAVAWLRPAQPKGCYYHS